MARVLILLNVRSTTGDGRMGDDYVLYDGACPACARYIAATGLVGRRDIALIDARAQPTLVAEHAAAGRSIDDGMVVAIDGEVHFGAAATRKLAEIGRPTTPARRFLLWFVGKAPWANALYPALAAGRRGLLRLLGRPLIAPRKAP
jgi:predicted DCC family thiol-disulfide oxidoreductase YuxK